MKKDNRKPSKTTSASPPNLGFIAAAILTVTFIIYIPSLSNLITNWDDYNYLRDNDMVKSLSLANLKSIFSSFMMGNYHPLTIFTYAIEYHFSGLNPKTFHFTNLVLHLANTFLVLVLIYRFTGKNIKAAAVVALLFALHPMHVESVAWVSERKDVLYTLFFLLSILFYLRYVDSGKSKFLAYSFAIFILSILSKGQAVVLTPVLLLIDFYKGRKCDRQVLIEKIPFFILSIAFGIVAVYAQRSIAAVNEVNLPIVQSFFFGIYGLVLYLVKSLIPFSLSAFQPYPLNEDGSLPMWIYIMPVLIVLLAFYVYKNFRQNKDIVFGLLFFIITISIVLQFLPVGKTLIAERYTYIPYLGLFFIIGQIYSGKIKSSQKIISSSTFIVPVMIIIYAIISWQRMGVWKNNTTLWSDVLEKYPKAEVALSNRAFGYIDAHDFQSALNDSRKLIEVTPVNPMRLNQHAFTLNLNGRYDEAIEVLNRGVQMDSAYAGFYVNRGLAYQNKKMFQQSVEDYSKAIKLNPDDYDTYMNRGIVYTDNLGMYDLGIKDFQKVLDHNPSNANAILNIGTALFKSNRMEEAIKQYSAYIVIFPREARAYYFRSRAYVGLGDFRNAYNDAIEARNLGLSVNPQEIEELRLRAGQ